MVISPNIFRKVKRKPVFSDSTFGGHSSFKVAPKTFKAVYMTAFAITEFALTLLYKSINITLGGNASVTLPGVGTDYRTTLNPLSDKGKKRFGLNVGNHFGPHLAASAKDAEDRGLLCSSATLGTSGSLRLPFVLPLASHIGLINLDGAAEDL